MSRREAAQHMGSIERAYAVYEPGKAYAHNVQDVRRLYVSGAITERERASLTRYNVGQYRSRGDSSEQY